MTTRFLTAYNPRTGSYYVGINDIDAMRVRVDIKAGEELSELKFYTTQWTDPANPWLGGKPLRELRGLTADYT